MHRTALIKLAVVALAAGCCGSILPHTSALSGSSAARPGPTDAILAVHDSPRSAATLRVLTEPAAGIGPIYGLITGARSSVDLTMYELADPTAEADLAAAAARGVDVRVILDQHLERSANTKAYDYLTAHGVHVRWAPAAMTYHQKTLTVDGSTSVIMTLNLVASDYRDTRDFAVIDTSRADVAAIVRTFDVDFSGTAITPPDGTDLVWSPTNAQSSVLSVINGATRTLAVEEEEMDDPAVTALAAAARRGVTVTVTMTADSEWDQAFNQLAAAGVHIRLYRDSSGTLYIHAKAIVADAGRSDQRVLVGSQNFSVASLDHNRELGILTSASAVVKAIAGTLASDYAGAAPYSAGPAEQPPAEPGFWCTATAVAYNLADDENYVYVNSDQGNQVITASTGGYSSTTQTNSFGYALIFLYGPPPGATITVKVGGATCTARS